MSQLSIHIHFKFVGLNSFLSTTLQLYSNGVRGKWPNEVQYGDKKVAKNACKQKANPDLVQIPPPVQL